MPPLAADPPRPPAAASDGGGLPDPAAMDPPLPPGAGGAVRTAFLPVQACFTHGDFCGWRCLRCDFRWDRA